ncbi:fumarate hydratase C-terminal domain-containing protein [Klebsiella pneumoniae subsp. pneumoniae]|nr:fumarate hydratase C-terminal domain-containing protein [Klebsiella pneumoniae subsp. pneumoniae]
MSTRLSLSGTIIVARDIAHAKLKELIDNGQRRCRSTSKITRSTTQVRPRRRTVAPSGSLGPTTAGRMDSYVDLLQSHGARARSCWRKGNRSQQVTDACHKHGGFYLGSSAARRQCWPSRALKSLECVAYPELGMEAIWEN